MDIVKQISFKFQNIYYVCLLKNVIKNRFTENERKGEGQSGNVSTQKGIGKNSIKEF